VGISILGPMAPAIFLDRDGVINVPVVVNGKSYPPADIKNFRLIDGVKKSIIAFRDAGYRTIIVTNQPDVATGEQKRSVVEAMHAILRRELVIDDIYVCYHIDQDACDCRKPKPGMLIDAQRKWNLDLDKSYMIGDRWRDIEAGTAAGCQTIFLDYGYVEKSPENPDYIIKTLAQSVPLILSAQS
jgi:D-glycero-D-manno-heptose 1,7-bisphosphate phosphatase